MELNIEQILQSERAWEYVLLDIVKSEEIDPWDIDLTVLTSKYLEKVREMEKLDLRVPARLIMAAAVLLRLQSDQLMSTEEEELIEDMLLGEDLSMFQETDTEKEEDELPILDLRVSRKPSRKVTLGDLILTLQKSLKKEDKPKRAKKKKEKFWLELPEEVITEQIDKLYDQILKLEKKKIAFSELSPSKKADDVVNTLIPLLHLANDHKVDIDQKEFFKEILVSPKKSK